MAAVKAACEQIGGRIEIDSVPGKGTEVRFTFGIQSMAPETVRLLSEHGIEDPIAVVTDHYFATTH